MNEDYYDTALLNFLESLPSKEIATQQLLEEAMNPKTDPERLDQLSGHDSYTVKKFVAQNISTPVKTLEKLSEDPDDGIRSSVLNNSKVTQKIVLKLSKDSSRHVRSSVATCKKTPTEILIAYSKNEEPGVKLWLMYNENTPAEALDNLLKTQCISTLKVILSHLNCTPEIKNYINTTLYLRSANVT